MGAARGRARPSLRTPLPSTDALDTLFTLRVASQRRDSTAKALAEPLLERCKHLLGAGGAVLGRCRPCCSLPSTQFRPKTPRFRRFRLQRLHTFLTNSRFHIIYLESRNLPIQDVRNLPKAASFSNLGYTFAHLSSYIRPGICHKRTTTYLRETSSTNS